MEEFTVLRAKAKDAEILAEIGAETFWDAYHTSSHLEQKFLRAHIKKTFTKELIEAEISEDQAVYLMGKIYNEAAGYARLLVGSSREGISGKKSLEIFKNLSSKKILGQKVWRIAFGKMFRRSRKTQLHVCMAKRLAI